MFSNNNLWEVFERCFVMCAIFYDFFMWPFFGVTEHGFFFIHLLFLFLAF